VYPLVPPQVASVETFFVDEGAGADEDFVEVTGLLLPQFPKPGWQPVPQYAVVDPHQPALLQQLPKVLPKHVYLLVPPQVASLDTVCASPTEIRPAVRGRRNFIFGECA
jgi:hypothetical protein